MGVVLYDPVGDVEVVERAAEKALDTVKGRAVGYIFNQHISATAFWKHLEERIAGAFEPSREVRVYKNNTWAPAPKAEVQHVLEATDYALVGVGA